MQSVANIVLTEDASLLPLFIGDPSSSKQDPRAPEAIVSEGEVRFGQGTCLSFGGYFNVFFEQPILAETDLREIELELDLEGHFEIVVRRTRPSGRTQAISSNSAFLQAGTPFRQTIALDADDPGYVHFALRALGDRGLLRAGRWATREKGREDIYLAVIVCTHRREEALRRLVSGLAKAPVLRSEPWNILAVDNARTLEPYVLQEFGCTILPQQNCGGAGGFTRGILETLDRADSRATHLLLMDDDIEIHPETLFRSIQFLRYQASTAVVGAPLFDSHDPCRIDVSGETFGLGKSALSPRSMLGRFAPVGRDLARACRIGPSDWTGWWFSIFPRKIFEEDLPLPVFIRGDDIEFGLRLKKKGTNSRYMPGWAIWHEPFGSPLARVPDWIHYYNTRNGLVHRALHSDTVDAGLLAWQIFHQQFNHYAYTFQYGVAELLLDGAEDFLRGPHSLLAEPLCSKHARVVELASIAAPERLQGVDPAGPAPRVPWWVLLAGALTLHGHLVPSFLSRRGPLAVQKGELRRRHAFGRETLVVSDRHGAASYARKRSKLLALRRRRNRLKKRFTKEYAQAAEMWRSGITELQSRSTWRDILSNRFASYPASSSSSLQPNKRP